MQPEQARAALASDLPPVLLVAGSGSAKLVLEASQDHGWAFHSGLNAAVAREILAEAWLTPESPRVTALCMDGVSVQVQNMLLKVLEEPPPGNFFVLCSSSRLLPTVMSRCQVIAVSPGAEEAAAPDHRDILSVAGAVRAARANHGAQLAQIVREWTPARAALLTQWAAEAAAGRWRVFSDTTVPGVRPEQALRLLQELSMRAGSRLGPLVALQVAFPAE